MSISYWRQKAENADKKVMHYFNKVRIYEKKYNNNKTKYNERMLTYHKKKLFKWQQKQRYSIKKLQIATQDYARR